MSTIDKQVRNFMSTNYVLAGEGQGVDAIGGDESLMELGIIDSVGVFALVDFIEDTYGISVNDSEIVPENLDSIDRIVHFINQKNPVMQASNTAPSIEAC